MLSNVFYKMSIDYQDKFYKKWCSILSSQEFNKLIDDYNKGIENVVLDKYIKELSDILFCETNPIPIKYVLSKKGYNSMYLRLPLVELSKEKQPDIDIILNL